MPRKIFKEEHQMFRDSFRKFLDKEVVPFIEKWEYEGIVPKSVWKKMGENGFLCPWLEEKYGGSNAGYEYSVVISEELSYIAANGSHAADDDQILERKDGFREAHQFVSA